MVISERLTWLSFILDAGHAAPCVGFETPLVRLVECGCDLLHELLLPQSEFRCTACIYVHEFIQKTGLLCARV